MIKELIVRLAPAVYLKLNLAQTFEAAPTIDLEKRQVSLPRIGDLDTVLVLLKELMLSCTHKHKFCLKWGSDCYYFSEDGEYTRSQKAPESDVEI